MKTNSFVPSLAKIVRTGQRQNFVKGETICTTDDIDAIYLVERGFVKRFEIMNEGHISSQGIYGSGDIFSLTYIYNLLLHKQIYTGPEVYYYEAVNNVVLYKLSGPALKEQVEANELIYKDLFTLAGNRFLSNIQLLESSGLPTAQKRVAHLILFYTERYGVKKRYGNVFAVPLTQQDLADILNLTRESVSLAVSSLKRAGLVKGVRKLIVPDLEKLRDEAYS